MNSTVFHVSKDASDILRALNSAMNLLSVVPQTSIHIIINGSALAGIAAVGALPEHTDVVRVSACAIGMKAHKVTVEDLPVGVGVVDSAVAQLSREQWSGAAYVAF